MILEAKKPFSFSLWVRRATMRLLRPLSIVEVLLHTTIGERYVGFSALLAPALMIGLAVNCESTGLLLLAIAFIIRILIHYGSSTKRFERGGELVHSRYPGRPLFGLLNSRMEEATVRGLEAWIVVGVGLLIRLFDDTLGEYLLWSGGAMLVVIGLRESITHHELLDRLDAEIERRAEDAEFRKHMNRFQPREITVMVDESAKTPLLEVAPLEVEAEKQSALAIN